MRRLLTAALAGLLLCGPALSAPPDLVGRIMVIECRGLQEPQAVYYALRAPVNVRLFFDEQFRLRMNAAESPTLAADIRREFEATLREMGIPGDVELEVLVESDDSSSGIKRLCAEQRENRPRV